MEYVPLGSLRDYLPRHSVGLAQLLMFAQQICEVGRPRPSFQRGPPLLLLVLKGSIPVRALVLDWTPLAVLCPGHLATPP